MLAMPLRRIALPTAVGESITFLIQVLASPLDSAL